jgi:uncharacterized delta-60 repeat protein
VACATAVAAASLAVAACVGSGRDTFGAGGKVVTDIGDRDAVSDVALLSDGKIVVAGSTSQHDALANFLLARYTSEGHLDETFGRAGKILTDFGETGVDASLGLDGDDAASSIEVQHDGKIVVAGSSDGDLALARYEADGSVDLEFGTRGKVVTDFSGGAAMAIERNGKIVVAGGAQGFALARYLPDGTLDPTFGRNGTISTQLWDYDAGASGLALQADGNIVVAGSTGGLEPDFAVARYTANGRLDPTFGAGGTVTTAFGKNREDVVEGVAIQADGRIVAVGWSGVDIDAAPYDFAVARYTSEGRLDTSFGSHGRVRTSFGPRRSEDVALALSLQGDGKIVAVGYSSLRGRPYDFALARYTASGRLDSAFGTGGKLRTDLGRDASANSVAVQPDGKIVVAGEKDVAGDASDTVIVRYTADGRVDS